MYFLSCVEIKTTTTTSKATGSLSLFFFLTARSKRVSCCSPYSCFVFAGT